MRIARSRYLSFVTLICLILTSIPLPSVAMASGAADLQQPIDEVLVSEDFTNGPVSSPWYDMRPYGAPPRVTFDGDNAIIGGQGDGDPAALAWFGGDHQGFIHAPKRDDEVVVFEAKAVLASGMGPQAYNGSFVGLQNASFQNGPGPNTEVAYGEYSSRYGNLTRYVDLGADYADGQAHTFTIQAYAKKVVFSIDGVMVVTRPLEGWYYQTYGIFDNTLGRPWFQAQNRVPGDATKVDWLRITRKTALVAPQVINGIEDPLSYLPQEISVPTVVNIPRVTGVELTVTGGGTSWTQTTTDLYGSDYLFQVFPTAPGQWTLQARYLFEGGVRGPLGKAFTFTYVAPPPAPVITTDLPALSGDRIVGIKGTVPAGATPAVAVEVYLNAGLVTTVPLEDGHWSCEQVTLLEGYNHIVAVSVSQEGVRSALSNAADTIYDPEGKYVGDLDPKSVLATMGGTYTSGFDADPVNTSTGNFIHQETDLVIYGPLPITFERYYNSLDPYFGSLGNGWRHSFEYAVDLRDPAVATVIRPDGRRDNYHVSDEGFTPPPGVGDELQKETGGGYLLKTKDGLSYSFNAPGVLTTISDRSGHTLTVESQVMGPYTRVTSVKDQAGHGLRFEYDDRYRLTAVTDHTGRKVSFEYDDWDDLTKAVSVDGYSWGYHYNPKGQLTEIIDPDGRTAIRNVYDDQFRVSEQYDVLGRKTGFDYDRVNGLTTVTAPNGATTVDKYDDLLRLIERTDRDGKKIGFAYDQYGYRQKAVFKDGFAAAMSHDAKGNITGVTDRNGVSWTMAYGPGGDPLSVADQGGNTWSMEYDDAGRLVRYTDPIGVGQSYQYDSRGNLTMLTGASGAVTHLEYDENDQVIELRDDRGLLVSISYNDLGLPTTLTDGRGNATQYEYDAAGRPLAITDGLGQVTRVTYNWRGQPATRTLPSGDVVTYDYNPDGSLAAVHDSLGRGSSYTYDALGNVATETDALGNTTTYVWDAAGRVTEVHDPTGAVTTYEYDDNGLLLKVRSAAGAVNSYEYDKNGRVTVARNAVGGTERYEYDQAGNLLRYTDALGLVTSLTYDAAGRPLDITFPTGTTIRYEYDEAGRVARMKDQRDGWYAYAYDGRDKLQQVVDPLGRVTKYFYDEAGNTAKIVDPMGGLWSYEYDPLNRVIASVDPLCNRSAATYDSTGQVTEFKDPLGRVTSNQYDLAGRLQAKTDPAGQVTRLTYDLADRLTSVTDPRGVVTAYQHDARGLLTGVIDPLGRATVYSYDEDARLTGAALPDGTATTYAYNPAGWLTDTKYSDGSSVAYGYDQAGLRQWMKDWTGVTLYGYDDYGRLSSIQTPDSKLLSYSYNQFDDLTAQGYPDGRAVSYGYDELGRMASVTDWQGTSTYAYDDLDRPTVLQLPGGLQSRYYYDPDSRLSLLENVRPNGDLISSYLYTYDPAGQVTSVTENYTDRTDYAYDAAGRLTSATGPDGQYFAYGYDAAGNVTTDTRAERDKDGNLKTLTTAYDVDLASQLVSSTETGGKEPVYAYYTYDQNGRLILVQSTGSGNEQDEEAEGGQGAGDEGVPDASPDKAKGQDRKSEVAVQVQDDAEESEEEWVTTEYSYNAAGRLVEVYEDAGPNHERYVTFAYDGDGNRVGLEAYVEVPGKGKGPVWKSASVDNSKGKGEPGGPPPGTGGNPKTDGFPSGTGSSGNGVGNVGGNGSVGGNGNGGGNGSAAAQGAPANPGNGVGRQDSNGLGSDHGKPADKDTRGNAAAAPKRPERPPAPGLSKDKGKHYAKGQGKGKGQGQNKDNKVHSLELSYVNDPLRTVTEALATYDGEGLLRDSYVYGLSRLAAYGPDGSRTSYMYDGLGSVRQLADSSGFVTQRYQYTPYGAPVSGRLDPSEKLNTGNTFGFAGQDVDPVFSLSYLRARYYAPTMDRFLTPDPLASAGLSIGGLSTYSFANDNPLSFVDPTGLLAERIGFKFIPTPGQLKFSTALNAVFAGAGTLAVAGLVMAGAAPVAIVLAGVFALSHAIDVVHDFEALANRDYIATEHGDPLYDAVGQVGGPVGLFALFAVETLSGEMTKVPSGRIDYSKSFTSARNFEPGTAVLRTGPAERDFILVQLHASTPPGEGRTWIWWTTADQANQFQSVEEAKQSLALLPEYGPRNEVTVARIRKGTEVTYYEGLAAPKTSGLTGAFYPGMGVQLEFRDFDPSWIVETRKLP